MRKTLKKYFVPHRENNYHPHILHTKRTIFYGAVFLATKIFMVAFVIMLPMEVFGLPDVLADEQRQIVELTNQVRRDHERLALAVSTKLDRSAQSKSDDMAAKEYFAHSYDKKNVSDWVKGAGYDYEVAGENLAVGFTTAQEVVDAWVNSPTHYANLVDSDFKDLGVGLTSGNYEGQPTVFIAQHFAAPAVAAEEEPAKLTPAKKPIVASTTTTTSTAAVPEVAASSSVLAAKIENTITSTPPLISKTAGSTIDKYVAAKSNLNSVTNIFTVLRFIYLFAIVFFIWALLLKILIEIKKQHPHVILQTSALIALLFVLWKF